MMDTHQDVSLQSPPSRDRGDLFILAMDHRASLLSEIYHIDDEPSAAEVARVSADKSLIFEGLLSAVEDGVEATTVGVLVDERYGASVATKAHSAGIDLAMPIERSGQQLFSLEFGDFDDDQWLRHVEAFDPDQVKVLVRDNPSSASVDRQQQFDRLAAISAALRTSERTFLVELLLPATRQQLKSVGNDPLRYDGDVRPALTVREILDLQGAGVEPQIWKIEGLETPDAALQVVAAATRDGRDKVNCIVLGRNAPRHRVDHWLTVAASVSGFRGFAIGRSVWEQPLIDYLAGTESATRLVQRVAQNFTHFVNVYAAEADMAAPDTHPSRRRGPIPRGGHTVSRP